MNPGVLMVDLATETVISTYGEAAEGFLFEAGPRSAAEFQNNVSRLSRAIDLPSWVTNATRPVPLGGDVPNDLVLSAPVQLTDRRAWEDLLGTASSVTVEADRVTATLTTQRRLDIAASRAVGAPVVAQSEGLVILVHSPEPREEVSALVVDADGIREIANFTINAPRGRIRFPDRRRRYKAYPDALVGWQENRKMYFPVETRDELQSSALGDLAMPVTFGGGRRPALTLGSPVGDAPKDRDEGESERDRASFRAPLTASLMRRDEGGWDGPDEAPDPPPSSPATTNTYTSGSTVFTGVAGIIGIERNEGGSGQTGWGPQSGSAPSYGSCTHYNSRDECKNCCLTVMTWGLGIVVAAGIACHSASGFWCLPCHFACGFIEGAAATILVLANKDCQNNCEKSVSW